ncbi:xanthine dehydrogenase accessory protein XdhC [Alcaligenaceae bacterium]|nr:xanthine dehydrogenase accessory protein XdhC [Alcaligenaceae bacterium]
MLLPGAPGVPPTVWFGHLLNQLETGQPQVLITVVRALGSVPRDPGARMWVGQDSTVDTIGGGHLEWQAIAKARDMLQHASAQSEVVRYALGPSLGQCCGGVVWLAFERLDQADLPWGRLLMQAIHQGRSVQRLVRLDNTKGMAVTDATVDIRPAVPDACCEWNEADKQVLDVWAVPATHIVVCGAGHVGHAVVAILASLPVTVSWLDPRDDCWPAQPPRNVRCIQGDADDVIDLPDNAYWLILTHNHALDMQLVEAIFQHRKFQFLGLIGSKTKKARFVSRLSRRFPSDLIERMECPIGLVATSSKEPAIIAVSVVAQLLSVTGA